MAKSLLRKLVVLGLAVALCIGLYASLHRRAAEPGGERAEPDRAGAAAEIVRTRTAARTRGEIDVSPCSAAGRVIDGDSERGIEGAVVLLRPRGPGKPVVPGEPGAPLTARTDASGDWSLPLVTPGPYILSASASGYLAAVLNDMSIQACDTSLDLTLAPGGHSLRGTVSDVSGGPVEGAIVSIDRQGEGNLIQFSRASFPAVSDAEGKFEVQVSDGVYEVSAWHADYTGDREVADVEGMPREVELRLTPAASIEGIVRAVPGGTPVEGAIVAIGEMGGLGGHAAVSDARGKFRLSGLPSGAHSLHASAPGHASREPHKVEVGIGEVLTDVEMRVERAFKITGFVVPKGEPQKSLAGVMIGAFSLNPMVLRAANGPSEVDGYFEVFGVQPGTYSLGSVAEQALPEIVGGPTVTIEDADATGVVVQLDLGVELRGRVEPPAMAAVSLSLADDPGFLTMIANLGNMFVRTRADARGEFTLRPVKPGKLRLIAEAPDGSRGEVDVDVGSDGLKGAVVVLEPRATVTGRVVDARGVAVKGGSVQLQPVERGREGALPLLFGGGGGHRHPIAEDGTYRARGLEGGEYEVRILDRAGNVIRWHDRAGGSYEPVRKTISAAVVTPGVDFTVEARDGVLRGVVLDPDGAPTPDAWVTVMPEIADAAEGVFHRPGPSRAREKVGAVPQAPKEPGDRASSAGKGEPALTGEDGRFEFTGLARRTFTLRVEALRGRARAEIDGVSLGTDVRVHVMPLAELAVTARSGGKIVPRYELHVQYRRPNGSTNTTQEKVDRPDGVGHLDHLDPGTYVLTAVADEGRREQELQLKPGERGRVTIELEPWGTLRGVLLDARSGQPIVGAALISFDKASRAGDVLGTMLGRGPRTDATGRFEIRSIAGGEGELHFQDGDGFGGDIATARFTLSPGSEKDLGVIYGVNHAKIPRPERGDLGLRTRLATEEARPRPVGETPPSLKEKEDPKAPRRLWIEAVTIDGPADKAGLLPGDEVISVDGTGVAGMGSENAARLLTNASIRRGQTVTLEVARAGGREMLTIEAAPMQP